ncbi:MAG: superoxide dismutase copper/zinc binding protein [Acidobacteria bacterium]|nr:superoxide dismutase copper/zinc binding protein [Acidobacteriota bacterium]
MLVDTRALAILAFALAGPSVVGAQAPAAHAGHDATTHAARPQQGPAEHGTVVARASADIAGKGITGSVDLIEYKAGTATWVQVSLSAQGLTPGLHGVHLHEVGACEPDFGAAGGHFDPGPASNPDPDANHPFHMGDLPNLSVGDSGQGSFVAATTRVTLSDGPLTVFDGNGTAIIIHANPDQAITGPSKSGVSGGPRVACGVLRKR